MKLATIVANTEKKINGEAIIFVAEPTPEQERLAGKLFAIIEIDTKKNDAKSIANFIVNKINSNYYENEKLLLRDKINDLKIENIFETILVKTNSDLVEFLIDKKISVRPQDVNITIGIIYENQIHFSNTGKNKPLLLHCENDGKYTMINIKCDDHENNKEYNLRKIFSSIISGEIPNKSYFVFANESLSEYLFNKEIINIISKLAPAGAAEQAKNTLLKLNIQAPFLGIIIKNSGGNNEEFDIDNYTAPQKNNDKSQAIVYDADKKNNLKTLEQKTEAIMSSGGVINADKIKEGVKNIIRDNKAVNAIAAAGKKIIENSNRPKGDINTSTTIDKEFLNDGSPKRKIFKITAIVLGLAVVVFAGNLLFQKHTNNKIEVAERIKTTKEVIEQKENQIESYMLYKNENSAKVILGELKTIIDGLKDSEIKDIDNYAQLLAKYQAQSDEVNHVQKIIPLSLKNVINFSDVSADAVVDNITIVNDGGIKKIYASANNKKTIFKRNLSDGVNGVVSSDKIKSGNNYPLLINNNLIYYIDENQITKLDTKNDQLSFSVLNLAADKKPIGISLYNDKLYIFEKTERKLLKFSLINGAYDKAETRLTLGIENTDINNFAINLNEGANKSYILVLKNNGVLKYLDGKQQSFNLGAVEPALSAATGIKILKNIYIMEPQNKRVIVFDKAGKLIKQYQSEELNNLKDFSVDETTNTLYFLNGNNVLETSLK